MKKPTSPVLLLLSLLSLVSLGVGQPSPFNTTGNSSLASSPFNITIGSSLSASLNETSYWLSPSGIFAFGFYPLCFECGRYKVGIWINNDPGRTLVWSAEFDDYEPIYDSSSLLLNHEGVFMLQRPGLKEKRLFSYELERASYALMHDNGNFIVYNPESVLIWQSFDHPTDTILSGQTLKTGQKLVSSYKLVMEDDGNLVMYNEKGHYRWKSKTRKKGSSPVVLNLDSSGRLYLADWDGVVIKNLAKQREEDSFRSSGRHIIYRATLDPDKTFRLYEEKIGCHCGKSVVLWHSDCTACKEDRKIILSALWLTALMLGICFLIALVAFVWAEFMT